MRMGYAWIGVCWLGTCGDPTPEGPPAVVGVLVARYYIPAGTVIRDPELLFRMVRYVKEDAPAKTITDFAAVRGMVLARTLAEDQPLKERDLSATPLPPRPILPPGMRAVTMHVDDGAEKLLPGSRVDIVLALRNSEASASGEARLQGIVVLAVNRQAPDARDLSRFPLVTFLVTSDQAKELIDAQNEGVHRVSLRAAR